MFRRFLVLGVVIGAIVAAAGVGARGTSAAPLPVSSPGGPYSGIAGIPIQFNGSGSTGINLSFAWNFGDGTVGYGVIVGHTYSVPGVYALSLTVTDVYGFSSTATTSVTVNGAVVTSVAPASCFLTTAGFVCGNGVVVAGSSCLFGTVAFPFCFGPQAVLAAPVFVDPPVVPVVVNTNINCPLPTWNQTCKLLNSK